MKRREIFPQTSQVVHECGLPMIAFTDGTSPHFIVEELHMELCPRCFRNLINDWMDDPWRFWTPQAWRKLDVWRIAIDGIGEESL